MTDPGHDPTGGHVGGGGYRSPSRRAVLRMVAGVGTAGLLGTGHEFGAVRRGAASQHPSPARLTDRLRCIRSDREIYGPTDVNAQTANGRLAVGINRAGTVTVYKWPRPSYYDQIKYFASGRDENNDIRVLPNAGAFLGIRVNGNRTTWLRDWDSTDQRYANDAALTATDGRYSDEIVTDYHDPPLSSIGSLSLRVRDLVTAETDTLVRFVEVLESGGADLELVAFENVSPVISKHVRSPTNDWCEEETNRNRSRYDASSDAIVNTLAGIDESTGGSQRVAVAMGTAGSSTAHQVGGDAHEPTAEPTTPLTRDAYEAASAGTFPGNDQYVGHTTGAIATELADEVGGSATVFMAADHRPADATSTIEALRSRSTGHLRAGKERWITGQLTGAPLPGRGSDARVPEVVTRLCRRALTTLVTSYDRHPDETGAIVASITTQPPYGEDWVRDGAYFNYVLSMIGHHDRVETRGRWYAAVQQRADDPRPSHPDTPPGNWAMVYYADGVAGGPIPYEIDMTGYGIWTLWDHYQLTGDDEYLQRVYPAIERAAEFLVRCRDTETDLHCRPAWEDDRPQTGFEEPTIVGAAPVWLGLKSAVAAAAAPSTPGTSADATRYETRLHELGQAIDRHLYDDDAGAYGSRIPYPMREVGWPVRFTPYTDPDTGLIETRPTVSEPLEHPRMRSHLDAVWDDISVTFTDPTRQTVEGTSGTGQYESKGLIPLAMARRRAGPGSIDDVRAGLSWVASEHATPDTHVMGEAWQIFTDQQGNVETDPDGSPRVRSIIAQPHIWEQILFYLGALEAWPPARLPDGTPVRAGRGNESSVLAAIREANAP